MTQTTYQKLVLWLPLFFIAFYTFFQINKTNSNNHSTGASAGFSGGGGTGANAGYNTSNGRTKTK